MKFSTLPNPTPHEQPRHTHQLRASKGQYHPVKPPRHMRPPRTGQSGQIQPLHRHRSPQSYWSRIPLHCRPKVLARRLSINPFIHKSMNPLPEPSKGQYQPVKPGKASRTHSLIATNPLIHHPSPAFPSPTAPSLRCAHRAPDHALQRISPVFSGIPLPCADGSDAGRVT